MENFQSYPLSSCYSMKSHADDRFFLIDKKRNMSRFTSHDSGVSFSDSDNESLIADICESDIDQIYDVPSNRQQSITITNDAYLASLVSDDDKKLICENTVWAWHGEFGRLIMATAMKYNVDYRLILYDDRPSCTRALNAHYSILRLDNAKAQFKCDTCGHCWTSMRARCSFHIARPDDGGIVLLKLYEQQCQHCHSTVHPLWYYDEICRVMKNLAFTIFQHCFPESFQFIYWDLTHNGRQPTKRLLQRKGNMHNKHNTFLCEACHLGLCF